MNAELAVGWALLHFGEREETESERESRGKDLERLIDAHQKNVFRIALSVLGPGHEADAEDVAQEVFLRAMRALESFRGESSIATWLHRIAYNTAIESRRRVRFRSPHVALEQVELTTEPAAGLLHYSVRAAVDALPDDQRSVVHLHYWLGSSSREIADLLGLSDAAVRTRLHRGRRRLKETLGKES